MKRINIIGITVLFAMILIAMVSCTKDFDEINKDPNNPSTKLAAPEMLLTNAIESLTDRVHEIFLGHEMGSGWVQHMAKVQYTDEDRYRPRLSVINISWTSFYAASGKDVQLIYDVAVERDHKNYQGVALVLRTYISSVITDLFGPVPYTEAWQGETNTLPKYDSQESIYRDMIAKLETANTLLDPAGSAIDGDILFNNNITAWKKFANSLKMRLLLRMSGKDAPFVTTEMTKMINNAAKYPMFTSNADNAALQYLGSFPNNHPINENRKTRDDHRVSKNLIDKLYKDPASPDYRVTLYAELAAGTGDYNGIPNGLSSANAAAYDGNGLANTSKIGSFYTQATAPGMLMSFVELKFILAEAALKNYIPGGATAAKTHYEQGIEASYYQNADYFRTRLKAIWGPTFISWGWDGTSDILKFALDDFNEYGGWAWNATKAMEQIATQKWVAMFDQGLQSWFEWRRTGWPRLTPAAEGFNDGKIPVRVTYPTDEAARNSSQLAKGVTLLGGPDNLNTRVWWDID